MIDTLQVVAKICGSLLVIGGFIGAVARLRFGRWIGKGLGGAVRHGLVGAFEDALAHELTPVTVANTRLDRRVDHLEIINRDTAMFANEIADDLAHLRDQLDTPRPPVVPPRRPDPD